MKRPGLLRVSAAVGVLAAGIAGAQECPDPQLDVCLPALCGLPVDHQCSCVTCATGECLLIPRNCDDRDPCTNDFCDDLTGCHHTPFCDDGDPCTEATCVVMHVQFLPDFPLCELRPSVCDDGRVCDGAESCHAEGGAAVCEPGTPLDCDDHNACTVDRCDENLPGCEHTQLQCDDGDACTDDGCDLVAGCMHRPIAGCCETATACNDGDPCTADACSDRQCDFEPVSGLDALGCVCDRPQPAACANLSLPRPLVTARKKACTLVSHLTAPAPSRALAKVLHLWRRGARVARRVKVEKRLGPCADAVAAAYDDAADRAQRVATR